MSLKTFGFHCRVQPGPSRVPCACTLRLSFGVQPVAVWARVWGVQTQRRPLPCAAWRLPAFRVGAAPTHRGASGPLRAGQTPSCPRLWPGVPCSLRSAGALRSEAGEGAVQLWAGMSRVFGTQNWGSEWPFCRRDPHKSPSWIQCPGPWAPGPQSETCGPAAGPAAPG